MNHLAAPFENGRKLNLTSITTNNCFKCTLKHRQCKQILESKTEIVIIKPKKKKNGSICKHNLQSETSTLNWSWWQRFGCLSVFEEWAASDKIIIYKN